MAFGNTDWLRTQIAVVQQEEDPLGEDWKLPTAPEIALEQTGEIKTVCPSPSVSPGASPGATPPSGPISAGIHAAHAQDPLIGCHEGVDNKLLGKMVPYTLPNPISVKIERVPIGDLLGKHNLEVTPTNMAKVICNADPIDIYEKTGDDRTALAYAYMLFEKGRSHQPENLHYDAVYYFPSGSLLGFLKNPIIPAQVTISQPIEQTVPGIYPTAAEYDPRLNVTVGMKLFSLSQADEEMLRKEDPALLSLLKNELAATELHELGHWEIMKTFAPKYLDVVNDPLQGEQISALTIQLHTLAKNKFIESWNRIADEEKQAHEDYHRAISPTENKYRAPLPENSKITCGYAKLIYELP